MEMGERKRLLSDAVLSKNDGNGPALVHICHNHAYDDVLNFSFR
jgi:hypothetical protein